MSKHICAPQKDNLRKTAHFAYLSLYNPPNITFDQATDKKRKARKLQMKAMAVDEMVACGRYIKKGKKKHAKLKISHARSNKRNKEAVKNVRQCCQWSL